MGKNRRAHPASNSPKFPKWVLAAVCVILAAGSVFVFMRERSTRPLVPGSYRDFNLLLVTLDTTRADHLSTYGNLGIRTPNVDRLSKESYVFEDAIAQAPLTLPSHVSMMTGRLPVAHGVRDNAGYFLDQKEITLAEIMKKAGYATSAFVSAEVLESRSHIDQGFDVYDDQFQAALSHEVDLGEVQRRAGETEIEVERWLEDHKDTKFFTWVHFYDPHDPYDPPEPYKSEYTERPYDGEIAYVDDVMGKLFGKLDALHLKERTILILTGDHGEGLGEHNEATHAVFLYNTTQHVPLIIYVPGGKSGRIAGTVSLIDLAPTILELLGLENVPQIQGKSLVGKMNGKEKFQRMAYSESMYAQLHYGWSHLESITTDQYRYIRAPSAELYDRKKDQAETKNLIGEKPSIGKVLDSELSELLSKYSSANLAGPQKMDPETQERLRALGYIGTTARNTEESRKIDPKDKSDVMRRVQAASGFLQTKRYDLALQEVMPILESDPGIIDAHYVAGVAYIRTGKLDSAIVELRKTMELQPDDTRAMYNLGYAFELKGRNTDAEFWFLKALQLSPDSVFARLKLAHLYRSMNQLEKSQQYFSRAAQYYQKTLEAAKTEKTKAAIYSVLGEIYSGAGEIELAKENYVMAVQLASKDESIDATCFVRLGILYHERAQYEQEMALFQEMIRYRPNDSRGYFYLAKLLLDRKSNVSEVISLSEKGLSLNPPPEMQVFGHYLLGNAYNVTGRIAEARREFAIAEELEKSL